MTIQEWKEKSLEIIIKEQKNITANYFSNINLKKYKKKEKLKKR